MNHSLVLLVWVGVLIVVALALLAIFGDCLIEPVDEVNEDEFGV